MHLCLFITSGVKMVSENEREYPYTTWIFLVRQFHNLTVSRREMPRATVPNRAVGRLGKWELCIKYRCR